MTTFVWTDKVPELHRQLLTPGKHYVVVSEGEDDLCTIQHDEGRRIFIQTRGCAFLDGRAWNVETVADPAPPADPSDEMERLRADKDAAYEERNRLVALLAGMFPSGVKQTDIPGWDPAWHGAVYIDFPWGQASWHFHDSHAGLFAHLPVYAGEWDGHTTEAKYAAIAAAAQRPSELERLLAGIRAEIDWHEAEAARFVDLGTLIRRNIHDTAAARLRALLPQPTPEPEGK